MVQIMHLHLQKKRKITFFFVIAFLVYAEYDLVIDSRNPNII